MVDIHNHLLYGLDDGSVNVEMTLEMLNTAVKEGINTIIATPHYILGSNQYKMDILIERYNKVLKLIKENKIPIKLILGNEIYIDMNLCELLEKGKCLTLGSSKYILLEFPMYEIPDYISYIIYQLMLKGYKPIIAHPERYVKIISNPNRLIQWIEKGCFIQVNSNSITGLFGSIVKQTVKKMIQYNMVHFVATDAHTSHKRAPFMLQAYNYIKDWEGEDTANQLFINNPQVVIENKDFIYKNPVKIITKKYKKYKNSLI